MYVISEIGNNHNGNISKAKKLIKQSYKAGANCVKFQLFTAEGTVINKKKKIIINKKKFNEFKLLKKLELSINQISKLKKFCDKINIDFAVTATELHHIDSLVKLGVKFIKIASADCINHDLIKYACKHKNMKIIISTGMCNFDEINQTVNLLKKNNHRNFSLLHCVSTYPTKIENLNLKKIIYLKNKYTCDIGFSDHSISNNARILAWFYGAKIYEVHFKDIKDNFKNTVDAPFSVDYKKLREIVKTFNELEQLNKTKITEISSCEILSRYQFRQSYHAKNKIKKNTKIKSKDIILSRPGDGVLPSQKKLILNKIARRDIKKGKKISLSDFSIENYKLK